MTREELKQRIAEKLDPSKLAELEADLAQLSDEDLDQATGGLHWFAGEQDQRGAGDAAHARINFFSKYKEYMEFI